MTSSNLKKIMENMCVLITVRLIDMKLVNEFIDFHENRHKIIRKSIYHRKYHICNSISSICRKENIQITTIHKKKILEIFERIECAASY